MIEYLYTGCPVFIKNLSEARRHSNSAWIGTKLAGGVEGDLLRVCKLLSRAFISNIIDFNTKIYISVLYKKFREPEVLCAHMNGQWQWHQRQQLLGRQDWKVDPRNDIKTLCLGKITSPLSSRLPFAPLLFMWAHRTLVSRKFFYSIRNTKNQLKCYFIWWIWTSEGLHTLRRAYLSYPENFKSIWWLQVYFLESDWFLVMTGPPCSYSNKRVY